MRHPSPPSHHLPVITSARPPILTRPTIMLYLTAFGAMTSFYLLLSVVPVYLASPVAAGLATATMMLATVLAEPLVPRIVARLGYRPALAVGLILVGAPAALLPISANLALVLTVCLARGAGLAIMVVAGTALAAELVPPERRAEGLGLYGVAVGVPGAIGLPAGLWVSAHAGYPPVFLAAAGMALAALVATAGLPPLARQAESHQKVVSGLTAGIVRPAVVFAAITFASGVLVTFVPLATTARIATVGLLVQSCVTPAARWAAGRWADRHGAHRLLVPAVLATAVGVVALTKIDSPLATITGLAVFGVGFGIAQNVTLATMLERVPATEFARVSALWNLAYDAGMGIGAIGFGLLANPLGYPASFAATAAMLLITLGPTIKDGSRTGA